VVSQIFTPYHLIGWLALVAEWDAPVRAEPGELRHRAAMMSEDRDEVPYTQNTSLDKPFAEQHYIQGLSIALQYFDLEVLVILRNVLKQ